MLRDLVKHLSSQLGVGEFAAAEADCDFDLIPLFKESADHLDLRGDVVLVGAWSEAHLFEFDDLLILARFALALGLLVLEPPVVHQAAHGWDCVRCYLDKIESPLLGHPDRVDRRHDPQLFTIIANQPDVPDPDLVIRP